MFRFTIRELVLVTAVVALALGWGIDRLYTTKRLSDMREGVRTMVRKIETLEMNLKRHDPRFVPSTASGSVIPGP
jgi:hypothetical protein